MSKYNHIYVFSCQFISAIYKKTRFYHVLIIDVTEHTVPQISADVIRNIKPPTAA